MAGEPVPRAAAAAGAGQQFQHRGPRGARGARSPAPARGSQGRPPCARGRSGCAERGLGAGRGPGGLWLLRRPPPSPRRRPCTGGSGSRHSRPLPWAASLALSLLRFFSRGLGPAERARESRRPARARDWEEGGGDSHVGQGRPKVPARMGSARPPPHRPGLPGLPGLPPSRPSGGCSPAHGAASPRFRTPRPPARACVRAPEAWRDRSLTPSSREILRHPRNEGNGQDQMNHSSPFACGFHSFFLSWRNGKRFESCQPEVKILPLVKLKEHPQGLASPFNRRCSEELSSCPLPLSCSNFQRVLRC
ncbi:5E5 antigen-like [Pongo abelii]|uniref:5E5 antigen-like n=1 Tax=Pongo abelii TaxID=9601 RepID=UPI003003D6BA